MGVGVGVGCSTMFLYMYFFKFYSCQIIRVIDSNKYHVVDPMEEQAHFDNGSEMDYPPVTLLINCIHIIF